MYALSTPLEAAFLASIHSMPSVCLVCSASFFSSRLSVYDCATYLQVSLPPLAVSNQSISRCLHLVAIAKIPSTAQHATDLITTGLGTGSFFLFGIVSPCIQD